MPTSKSKLTFSDTAAQAEVTGLIQNAWDSGPWTYQSKVFSSFKTADADKDWLLSFHTKSTQTHATTTKWLPPHFLNKHPKIKKPTQEKSCIGMCSQKLSVWLWQRLFKTQVNFFAQFHFLYSQGRGGSIFIVHTSLIQYLEEKEKQDNEHIYSLYI